MSKSFTLEDMIACYATGVFPMSEDRDDPRLFLVDPEERGIFPLDHFHIPRRLRRTLRTTSFQVRIDTAFDQVVHLCAEADEGREETWINHPLESLYSALFSRGLAHSVEVWGGQDLVGGLYGVCLNGAFFGESMFSRVTDASKIALCHLVARLKVGGYSLLDAQFHTDHLAQFGLIAISREDYRTRLHQALAIEADFYALGPQADGEGVLHVINQAS